jgi:hypothetical protein
MKGYLVVFLSFLRRRCVAKNKVVPAITAWVWVLRERLVEELITHGRRNHKDTRPYMSSSLVFNRVYRLEIQSVMVFSTPLVNCCPLYILSDLPHPYPLPKVNVQYIQTVCGCGGGGVELCCRPYSAGV